MGANEAKNQAIMTALQNKVNQQNIFQNQNLTYGNAAALNSQSVGDQFNLEHLQHLIKQNSALDSKFSSLNSALGGYPNQLAAQARQTYQQNNNNNNNNNNSQTS